jgi:hypothetical protein
MVYSLYNTGVPACRKYEKMQENAQKHIYLILLSPLILLLIAFFADIFREINKQIAKIEIFRV